MIIYYSHLIGFEQKLTLYFILSD